MRRKSIKVNTRCVADAYSAPNEKIIEFSAAKDGKLLGGLIAFRLLNNGTLRVDLYNLDPGVNVITVESKPGAPTINITRPVRT